MLSDFTSFIVGALLTSGIIFFTIKTYVKKLIDRSFQYQFEKLRFDYQRKVHDFGLYSNRRHEIYPVVYQQLLITVSMVQRLRGFRSFLTFDEFNEDDIQAYMENHRFPKGKAEGITKMWSTPQKQNAVQQLRRYLSMLEMQEAENQLGVCKGKVFENELFLSNEVSVACFKILDEINTLRLNYQYPDIETSEQNPGIIESIEKQLAEIKTSIRIELSVGDYKEN